LFSSCLFGVIFVSCRISGGRKSTKRVFWVVNSILYLGAVQFELIHLA